MNIRARVILAILILSVGLILIFAVPTPAEGPMLVSLSDEHAIRFVDAIGLALGIPSWLYLNLIAFRVLIERWKSKP